MKALVTGGTGFIGTHLAEQLRLRDFDTRAVGHRELDVTDSEAVGALMRGVRPQYVFHLAASNVMSGRISSPEEVQQVNVSGTRNVLEAAKDAGVKSIVITGSFLEYSPVDRPVQETDTCAPQDPYSKSKLAATKLGQEYAKEGLPVTTFRLFTPYGSGMQKGRLVRTVIEKALANEPIPLTEKSIARDFIYVDDICALLIEGALSGKEHAGEIFNLGTGTKTTLEKLVAVVLEKTHSKSIPEWGALPRVSYDADWQADMTKTFTAFQWRPKVGLEAGIEKTVEWLRGKK
jgi:nucleoside-diphosphate-sugar epimerase